MNEWQFYPTPADLGRLAWSKFQNKNFVRVLEPSAGDGALMVVMPNWNDRYRSRPPVDVLEIDVTKHPLLREKGLNVVGLDFLQFQNGSCYSHIILNPPFSHGVHHVLKAWDIIWDGEVVAILNAETLRNPFSKERQHLARLVAQFGSVEYLQSAFIGEGVRRETEVEIALVYLKKEANLQEDIFGDLLSGLSVDSETGAGLAADYHQPHELALPKSEIETREATFKAAVKAMKESVMMEARAAHYANLMGKTMAEISAGTSVKRRDTTANFVRSTIAERYEGLKDAAWAGIMRSADVTSRLSSKAHKRVEAEFENIKKLEFTTSNVYAFLCGLVDSQGQLMVDMACDVFDEITRYHSDNTVFYRGWVSNSKHRTAGMRIKTTRFVLPRNRAFSDQLDWDAMQRLRDFDKVFAMLDSKITPEVSLEEVFSTRMWDLKAGERLSSSYFDVRYYPGVQTIHFFPRDKVLIDRFNRLVGRHRQWLPHENTRVSDDFWTQYEKAEKFDKEVRSAVHATAGTRSGDPLHGLFSRMEEDAQLAQSRLTSAIDAVLTKHGISVDFQIEHQPDLREQLLLLSAA